MFFPFLFLFCCSAAGIAVGIAGCERAFAAFVMDTGIPALLRKGALDFCCDVSTLRWARGRYRLERRRLWGETLGIEAASQILGILFGMGLCEETFILPQRRFAFPLF